MKRSAALLLTLFLSVAIVALGFVGVMLLDSRPELIPLLFGAVLAGLFGMVRLYGRLCRRAGLPTRA